MTTAKAEKEKETVKSGKKPNKVVNGKTRLTVDLDPKDYEGMDVLSDLLGKPKHELIARAAEEFIQKHRGAIDNFLSIRASLSKGE